MTLVILLHLKKQSIASYGASMHKSVFRIMFLILAKEFESIETSPGFARQVSALRTSTTAYLLADFFVKSQHSFNRISSFNEFFGDILNLIMILLKGDRIVNEKSVILQCVFS